MKRKVVSTLMLAALGMAAISSRASAAPMTYTIVPTESSLSASIYLGGPPAGAAPGTLVTLGQVTLPTDSSTAFLSGTMSIDTSGGSITFGANTVTPLISPYPLLPAANGGSNTGPGLPVTGLYQFGLQLNTSIGIGTGYASISASSFSAGGAAPLSGGMFDPNLNTSITLLSGNLAYWLNTTIAGLVYGTEAAPATTVTNGVDSHGSTGYIGPGTVTTVGPVTTVKLPVFVDDFITISSGVGIDIVFSGLITATASSAVIPEPGSITLMGIAVVGGGVGWAIRRRRRQK